MQVRHHHAPRGGIGAGFNGNGVAHGFTVQVVAKWLAATWRKFVRRGGALAVVKVSGMMADQIENLVLEPLRLICACQAAMKADLRDVKNRLATVEGGQGTILQHMGHQSRDGRIPGASGC